MSSFLSNDLSRNIRQRISSPSRAVLNDRSTSILGCIKNMRVDEADDVHSKNNVLITGTPGIGKSVAIVDLLHRIIHGTISISAKTVLLDIENYMCIISFTNDTEGWKEFKVVSHSNVILMLLEDFRGPYLYIFDASYGRYPFNLANIPTIVFSSPNKMHFKIFMKDPSSVSIFYVPCWQWEEILAAFNKYFKNDVLDGQLREIDLFELSTKWGGLPRYIFRRDFAKQLGFLNLLIQSSNYRAIISRIEMGGEFLFFKSGSAEEVRSKLVHFDVTDDSYEQARIIFGSSYIRDELIRFASRDFSSLYTDFFKTHGNQSYASGLRGNLFEKCVLDNFPRANGAVPCFTMSKDCANSALFARAFFTASEIPQKYFKTLDEIEVEEGPRPCLWIPTQSNNYKTSFDGLLLLPGEALWLQVTVGVDHSLNSTGVGKCFERTGGKEVSKIVFCLPPDVFMQWHDKNSLQKFKTNDGNDAKNHPYLQDLKQLVICHYADSVEREVVNFILKSL